ncbi:MAG TPA: UDP-3-O-(3-hydroxymyristoyl)glucosamine N-acyltransferase [Gammaproteobacteria bacterium]|nr:UDP-3-O-(3-hydroxymyristoyl)glucosamine N-acyltransferase [Gammaproteobacteria bacterium]
MVISLAELAAQLGVPFRGDGSIAIEGVATLQNAAPGRLSFLANPRYRQYLGTTRAAAVVIASQDEEHCPVPALVSDNPYATYARAAALLYPSAAAQRGVHPSACVDPDARLAEDAWIGPMTVVEAGVVIEAGAQIGPACVIAQGARVGAHSRLVAQVTLCHGVQIGCRALIHPGVVIGSDGFGIANESGHWIKVPQVGSVVIGDDVEIGANTSIDRGAVEDTVLEDGVKLDNQIQVGHNVHIGAHTAIAGCVGIAGSARIGRHCAIGGGAGILGHLELADHVQVTAMTLVTRSLTEPGVYSSGVPAQPGTAWNRNYARFRELDELARRVRELEKKLAASGKA